MSVLGTRLNLAEAQLVLALLSDDAVLDRIFERLEERRIAEWFAQIEHNRRTLKPKKEG